MLKKKTIHSNYLLQMQIEAFWVGMTKTSKKSYFYCGPSSRTGSESTKKKLKEMLLEPSFVME